MSGCWKSFKALMYLWAWLLLYNFYNIYSSINFYFKHNSMKFLIWTYTNIVGQNHTTWKFQNGVHYPQKPVSTCFSCFWNKMAWSLQGKTSAKTVFSLSLNPCLIYIIQRYLSRMRLEETIVLNLFQHPFSEFLVLFMCLNI